MGTIAENLIKLKDTFNNIKTALSNKGKTVTKLTEVPDAINDITLSGMNVVPRTSWKVIFIDIDGYVFWEGFVEDGGTIPFAEADAARANHTHEGLTFVQWNQTDEIANHENYYDDGFYKTIVIGAEYDLTRDENGNLPPTTIWVQVNHNLNKSYSLKLTTTEANGTQIDWGDNTVVTVTNTTTATTYSHKYTSSGLYKVKIISNKGTYDIVGSTSASTGMPGFEFGLKKIIIGKGCYKLEKYSISAKWGLRELYIGSDCKYMESNAILNCYSISSLSLSPEFTTLAYSNVFQYCYGLRQIIIPHKVTTVNGSGFFAYNYGVNYISLPKSLVTGISTSFAWGLYPLYVSSRINKFKNNNYVYYFYTTPYNIYDDNQPQIECKSGRTNPYIHNVLVPSASTTNKYTVHYGFIHNQSIRKVTIKDGTTTIGDGTFSQNFNLREVILPSSVTYASDEAFTACNSLRNIDTSIALNSNKAFSSAFYNCRSLESITIPEDTKTINQNGCRGLYSVKNINIPPLVTTINSHAFYECYGLQKTIEPNTITSRSTYGYAYCRSLRYAKFSGVFPYIPSYTFYYCSSLQVLDFGSDADRDTVPKFYSATSTAAGTANYINMDSLIYIIVPDSLYDSWLQDSRWTSFKQYIIKHSDYYALYGKEDESLIY